MKKLVTDQVASVMENLSAITRVLDYDTPCPNFGACQDETCPTDQAYFHMSAQRIWAYDPTTTPLNRIVRVVR